MRKTKSLRLILGVILCFVTVKILAQEVKKPNILFIAIDDLKPVLGCYGDKIIKTPNIDRLAKMGTVFMSNYCQQAVCGPSRASIMTGLRPDYTQVWDLKTPMRDINPDILSLPQYFRSQGYSTQGIGKVYDPRNVDEELDIPSWSVPYYKTENKYYDKETGAPVLNLYQLPATKQLIHKYLQEAKEKGLNTKEATDYALSKIKPAVESADVPDNAYTDGANILQAKNILTQLSKTQGPFFFAVGISKPHLPFVAPKKYWDLYKREDMPVASFQEKAKGAVDIAYHSASEIRSFSDISPLTSYTDQKDFGLTLPIDKQKELIHGYYASVSYADAQVGILLHTLDSLELTKNTIIVLWGDHGWHLGDHNLWCKHSDFEQATHAPLIISAPNINASKTSSISEFVDVFPTLCDLATLKTPPHLPGKSLVSVMKNPTHSVKDYAVSQYPRSGMQVEKGRLGYVESDFMGYSIRTDQYRYTVWMKDKFRSTQKFDEKLVVGIELYDYKADPYETMNFASDKGYASISNELNNKIIAFFNSQVK
jgi:iduronate 2-sulfatase